MKLQNVERDCYVTLGTSFLPISYDDMQQRGWQSCDFIYIIGDAYVDHPSFGPAIISRVLEAYGYRVVVLSQPVISAGRIVTALPCPELGVLISSGNVDSMVAHYTVAKRKRSEDFYSPGKRVGLRPDRALTAYARAARATWPGVPIIVGGLEASLRRFAHYDYWSDSVRPSVLVESGADILLYGMGERSVLEVAEALREGLPVHKITRVRGTCYVTDKPEHSVYETIECAPFEHCRNLSEENARMQYAQACRVQFRAHSHASEKAVIQRHGNLYLVQNPPAFPLTQPEMDWVYSLPYCRTWHPVYAALGGVPAINEVRFSITHVRGCFGNCSFCSIAFHQGRYIQTRSHASVLAEARLLTTLPDFKGYIHDVGGPTANFRRPSCDGQETRGLCSGKSCLAPKPCPNLKVDHSDYLALLEELRRIPGVKKVFIRSGIRFDYLMCDSHEQFFDALVRHHISGQLKVAPEHCDSVVLGYMNKPSFAVFRAFKEKFSQKNIEIGKKQFLIPYLMSSHPGSTLNSAIELALFLKKEGLNPEQVQDFYPTPGTISTCMFCTGIDPRTMQKVYVPRSEQEKQMQRALLQFRFPQNRNLVEKALRTAGRTDLIGNGPNCLINASPGSSSKKTSDATSRNYRSAGSLGAGSKGVRKNGKQ